MIEETAQVVNVDGDDIWVETQRRSVCGQCAANKGCGTAVLGKVIGVKPSRVRVLNPEHNKLSIGEEIIIGIDERALVRGSAMIYIVPLVFLFLFGVVGQVVADQMNVSSPDLLVIAASIVGVLTGFFIVKIFTQSMRSDSRYQPVFLHRAIKTNE